MERVPTGIKGFDDMVEGGLVPSSVTIIGGHPGTGKTLFCSQFLYTGAAKYKEPGVYITLEQRAEDIKYDVKDTLGWDLEELEKKKMLTFWPLRIKRVFHPLEKKKVLTMSMPELSKKVIEMIDSTKAKRLVIDSVSIIDMMFEDKFQIRSELVALFDGFKDRGVTSLLTAEIPEKGERSEFIDFVGDMVIKLDTMYVRDEFRRIMTVTKMRRSEHSHFIHPYKITKNGIEVTKL
ncbi:MAG: hypothetical protein HYT70_03900 [Candidatus Aenigmarchaeota archaeon]|nr:hypothetical protein [Candidatus Aenigmarchaeota archaeon]